MSILQAILAHFRRPPVPVPPAPPGPGPPTSASVAQALLDAHNAARAARNLPPLRLDPRLCAAAQRHAEAMAARGVLSHTGLGDLSLWERIARSGYHYSEAAEAAAEGQPTAAAVVAAWMEDPPHRANVLGDYADLGGGMACGSNGVLYWCCDYGREA